jgi:hypothetical protein
VQKLNLVEGRPPQLMESFMKRALSALKTVFDFDVKLGYNTFASTMRLAPPELSLVFPVIQLASCVNKHKQTPLNPLPLKPPQTVNKARTGVESCKPLTPQPEVRLASP